MPFDRNTAKVNIAPKNKNGKIKQIRYCVREQCSLYKAETAFILIEIWCYVKITDTLNLYFLGKSAKCTKWSHLFHGLLDNEPLMA